jgi:Sulfotransferase family
MAIGRRRSETSTAKPTKTLVMIKLVVVICVLLTVASIHGFLFMPRTFWDRQDNGDLTHWDTQNTQQQKQKKHQPSLHANRPRQPYQPAFRSSTTTTTTRAAATATNPNFPPGIAPWLTSASGWDVSPIVIEELKLVFFTIPKVGCTEFKKFFRRVHGYSDWYIHQEPNLPHNPHKNGLVYLYDYVKNNYDNRNPSTSAAATTRTTTTTTTTTTSSSPLSRIKNNNNTTNNTTTVSSAVTTPKTKNIKPPINATIAIMELLQSPQWTRAIFVRSPLERVLSAYLDKGLHEQGDYVFRHCCKSYRTSPSVRGSLNLQQRQQQTMKQQQSMKKGTTRGVVELQQKKMSMMMRMMQNGTSTTGGVETGPPGTGRRRRLLKSNSNRNNSVATTNTTKATMTTMMTTTGPQKVMKPLEQWCRSYMNYTSIMAQWKKQQNTTNTTTNANTTITTSTAGSSSSTSSTLPPPPPQLLAPLLSFEMFVKNVIPNCDDPHWRPQAKRIPASIWPYITFVGKFDTMEQDAQRLFQQIKLVEVKEQQQENGGGNGESGKVTTATTTTTAWEKYGASGWNTTATDSGSSLFASNGAQHQTSARNKVQKYYTQELETLVRQHYQDDWKHPWMNFSSRLQ